MCEISVVVVLVNYNNWKDTIACIESILHGVMLPSRIVVVDNNSMDNSIMQIKHWADGNLEIILPLLDDTIPITKPIPLSEYTCNAEILFPAATYDHQLVLIHNFENRGYSAGNNVGIRYAMEFESDAVWLLNNDCVVMPNTLGCMLKKLYSQPKLGMCGSVIRYMDAPNIIQCIGGGYHNFWTGHSFLLGQGINYSDLNNFVTNNQHMLSKINFIYGASIMVSKEFIQSVGLLDTAFFLYCEEQDWFCRCKDRFNVGYALDAIVFHKEGASTGHSHRGATLKALILISKSRLRLTLKHKPIALPFVCIGILFSIVKVFTRITKAYFNKV